MYKAASANVPSDGAAASAGTADDHAEPKKDEGVIDAEYVDADHK